LIGRERWRHLKLATKHEPAVEGGGVGEGLVHPGADSGARVLGLDDGEGEVRPVKEAHDESGPGWRGTVMEEAAAGRASAALAVLDGCC
jgi:hypothetical protein